MHQGSTSALTSQDTNLKLFHSSKIESISCSTTTTELNPRGRYISRPRRGKTLVGDADTLTGICMHRQKGKTSFHLTAEIKPGFSGPLSPGETPQRQPSRSPSAHTITTERALAPSPAASQHSTAQARADPDSLQGPRSQTSPTASHRHAVPAESFAARAKDVLLAAGPR